MSEAITYRLDGERVRTFAEWRKATGYSRANHDGAVSAQSIMRNYARLFGEAVAMRADDAALVVTCEGTGLRAKVRARTVRNVRWQW